MFVLTMDRFLSIYAPFKYPKFANPFTALLSSLFWPLSFIHSILPLIGLGCYAFSVDFLSCSLNLGCSIVFCNTYYILASACVFLLGGVVPLVMYVMMIRLAWKLRRSQVIGKMDGDEDAANRTQIIQSELRATLTFFMLFLTLIGLTLPFYSVLLVDQIAVIFGTGTQLNLELFYFVLDVYHMLPIADAIIIAWNRDIKERIKDLLKLNKFCMT